MIIFGGMGAGGPDWAGDSGARRGNDRQPDVGARSARWQGREGMAGGRRARWQLLG